MKSPLRSPVVAIGFAAGLLLFCSAYSQTLAQAAPKPSAKQPDSAAARSLTIFPININPGQKASLPARTTMATVVGALLEKTGLQNVELSKQEFIPPQSDDAAEIAAAFAKYIQQNPPDSEYALFAQFVGTPQTGPKAILTVLLDRSGKLLLAARDTPATYEKFSNMRPKCPMTCSLFVARRVAKLWDLPDPLRPGATPSGGKMAALLNQQSTLPPPAELEAMAKRLEIMKQNLAARSVTVYPIHLAKGDAPACTKNLVAAINSQGLFQAKPGKANPDLKVEGSFNEQRMLWSAARAFQQFIRKNPPHTAYALYADYGICDPADKTPPATQRPAAFVHLILCDRAGEWVMVDFQNSHQPDFQKIKPATCDACNRLAVIRLTTRLSD